ncbi:serine protease [Coelomomyces lativittatus]|nr:serine protease [Coelomomyces lativittatus]KAJ1503607.1 serine protease [Coelomomyces lativittatus]KAJ1507017.1 serine protease [Coelomomyces lativittatus]
MRILLHRFLSCVVVCLYVGWSMAFTSPSLPNFQTDWTTALNSWGQMKDNGTLSSIEVIINRLLLLATTGENYIVVLNINITEDEFKQHLSWLESHLYTNTQYLGRISQRYDFGGNQSFYGYSGTFNGALLDLIKAIPLVKVVVRDEIVQTQQITNSQMTAPWGLARICQRNSLGGKATGTFTFNRKAGANVDAYILDTGVYVGT